MPPHTRNSRYNSPRREDGDDIASTSDDTLKEMMTKIMGEVAGMHGDLATMREGFTTYHENIALLRDRVRHNHSVAPSDRERHDRSGYKSRYHDDGLDRGSRREQVPKFHGESHSRRMRDHDHHKVHEWLMEEEVSSKARKSSNSRHYGGNTSRRSISPKKVDLSHPSYHTKVSSWLSSNFSPSKSLIQSKCDDVNYIVKERVKHRVDFVADDDEEQCEDETESTATHEEDAHSTFNYGVSSIVGAEDECEPLKALQVLSIETKPNEIAKVNDYLGNEQERKENIECEKRLKCEMQKPRESGGGECESKKPREKNYKHVRKKSCLLDSKNNLGGALNDPLPLALGEEDKLLPTNITCLPFCVDDFVVSKIEDKEVKHRIAHVKETTFPKKDQEEQGQVDELLPRGPSTLSLFPYDVSLNCLDKLDVLKENVNVEPILYDEYVIVDSTMKHVNVCGLEIPICLDVHNTCGLCGDRHVGLSHVLTKFGLTCYDDPFLRNSSGDKHILSFVDSCMKIGMLLLDAKMPILPLVGDYELLEHVVGESRAKSRVMFVVALNKLSMHAIDLVIHVGHNDSWIHCAYIFDHFLKLLGQDSDIFGDKRGCMHYMPSCKLKEMCETPTLNVEHEFVNLWSSNSYLSKNDVSKVPYNLSLFELVNRDFVIRPLSVSFNFGHYEDPFLSTPSTNKNNHSLVMKLMNLGMGSVGKMEAKGSKMFDACVFWHDLSFHCMSIKTFNGVGMFYGIFVKDFASNGFVWGYIVKEIFNLCVPISCSLSLSLVGHSNNGNRAFGLKHEHTHLIGVEPYFGAFGGQNSSCDTLIFDLDLLGFVGMLDRDLRTNPSKEGGNDVNPSVLKKNRRTGFEDKSFQKEGEDDANPTDTHHASSPFKDIHQKRTRKMSRKMQESLGLFITSLRLEEEAQKDAPGVSRAIHQIRLDPAPNRYWGSVQTLICLLIRCPNDDPRPPSSSSSKYLREGTSHAPNGVRMREIWPFDESRAELPTN